MSGRDPVDRQLGALGQRRRRRHRLGEGPGLRDRVLASPLQQRAPDDATGHGHADDADRGAEEPSSPPRRHLGPRSGGFLGRQAQQPSHRVDRDEDGRDDHDEGRDRLGQRVLEARVERENAERPGTERHDPRSGARQDAADARRTDRDRGDEQVEDELVGVAEQVDDELLGARRLERDDEVADGDDRAGRPRQDAGEQLGDAERERAGGDPCECRPPDRDRGLCRRLGGHALNTTRVAVCILRRRDGIGLAAWSAWPEWSGSAIASPGCESSSPSCCPRPRC